MALTKDEAQLVIDWWQKYPWSRGSWWNDELYVPGPFTGPRGTYIRHTKVCGKSLDAANCIKKVKQHPELRGPTVLSPQAMLALHRDVWSVSDWEQAHLDIVFAVFQLDQRTYEKNPNGYKYAYEQLLDNLCTILTTQLERYIENLPASGVVGVASDYDPYDEDEAA